MNQRLLIWIGAAFLVGVLLANIFFVVDQTHQAVVVSLGDPVRVLNRPNDYGPGLKMKWPWEERVLLDKRNQAIEVQQQEVTTVDQTRLVVDAFVRYRISDPLQYYRTLRNDAIAHDRLEPLLTSSLRQVLGQARSAEIISSRRAELMALTLADVKARAARSRLGIEILDLRIKRADLPTANAQAVFQRMRTRMEQQAAQTRAEGEQQRREIVAMADKDVTVTLATAQQIASTTQGEGDAKAAVIFANSFGKDPSFAAFFRSMTAYQSAMGSGDTTMVLSPDSDFFKYFKNGPNAK